MWSIGSLIVAGGVFAALTSLGQAQTLEHARLDAELEQRLELLERRIAQLESQLAKANQQPAPEQAAAIASPRPGPPAEAAASATPPAPAPSVLPRRNAAMVTAMNPDTDTARVA